MKKLISLLLIISFLGLHCAKYERGEGINLEPGQKPGAKLIVQKKDGQQVKGELIAVKENGLLLNESGTGADVSVDIENVSFIAIMKKSDVLLNGVLGLGIGLGAVYILGSTVLSGEAAPMGWSSGLLLGGGLGILCGLGIGAIAVKDKIIQFEGKSEAEIQKILGDLRKKARVPQFQ